jgi:hypothetical protein
VLAARFCLFALTLTLSAQDIIFRAETNEVIVPFAVFNERGQAQSCPAAGTLTVRENGVARPVLSAQQVNDQQVGIGIVFVRDTLAGFYTQDMSKLGVFIARDLTLPEDACTAIVASGDISHGPKVRFSDIGQGQTGCMDILDYISMLEEVWLGTGVEVGVWPFTWAGVQKAADLLSGDTHLRRAVLLLSIGRDADHFGMPSSLIRKLADKGIEAYAIYYGFQDLNDPEVQARSRKYGVSPLPADFFPGTLQKLAKGKHDLERLAEETGGKFYPVTRESAPEVARELVSNLRKGCVLTFSPNEDLPAAAYRKIDVEVAQKGWKVRHRPGYYPNQPSAPSGKPPTR